MGSKSFHALLIFRADVYVDASEESAGGNSCINEFLYSIKLQEVTA